MATPTRLPRILHPGESRIGRILNIFGDQMYLLVTGEDNNGALTIAEIHTPPGNGTPLHVHRRENEYFYILEGEVEFNVNGIPIRTAAGGHAFAPKDIPHNYTNIGKTNSRMVVVAQPAGIEYMFEEIHKAAQHGPPDLAALTAICARYGVEILGPPEAD
jgi:quercetin dioxygenase-like cupin family protein